MKGTEKQIAWATDIINTPVNIIQKYADHLAASRITSHHAVSASLIKSIETYRAMISSFPQMQDSAFVIDNRNKFATIAKEAVRRTLISDGIHPSEALANLSNRGL